jgi:AraC family transcriptional regulator
MRLQDVHTHSNCSCAVSGLTTCGGGCDISKRSVSEEPTRRRLADVNRGAPFEADIVVSRWIDSRNSCRHEKYLSSSDRHIFSVSLKTTRMRLTRDSHTIFDGIMPAGTLHVTGPSQALIADFRAPSDFIRFHVLSDYLRRCQRAAQSDPFEAIPDLNDLTIRDPLAELLGRALLTSGSIDDAQYAESVGQTLVMHIARLQLPKRTRCALPNWRLQRVQAYIDTHLDSALSLVDLASLVGLSRMHFAAQFREATGHRPHQYVLSRRIESAKAILSNSDMPIAEIALSVGFSSQSHFSTVFKRLAGDAPARWRRVVTGAADPHLVLARNAGTHKGQ